MISQFFIGVSHFDDHGLVCLLVVLLNNNKQLPYPQEKLLSIVTSTLISFEIHVGLFYFIFLKMQVSLFMLNKRLNLPEKNKD
jgi:hypothetical protein